MVCWIKVVSSRLSKYRKPKLRNEMCNIILVSVPQLFTCTIMAAEELEKEVSIASVGFIASIAEAVLLESSGKSQPIGFQGSNVSATKQKKSSRHFRTL